MKNKKLLVLSVLVYSVLFCYLYVNVELDLFSYLNRPTFTGKNITYRLCIAMVLVLSFVLSLPKDEFEELCQLYLLCCLFIPHCCLFILCGENVLLYFGTLKVILGALVFQYTLNNNFSRVITNKERIHLVLNRKYFIIISIICICVILPFFKLNLNYFNLELNSEARIINRQIFGGKFMGYFLMISSSVFGPALFFSGFRKKSFFEFTLGFLILFLNFCITGVKSSIYLMFLMILISIPIHLKFKKPDRFGVIILFLFAGICSLVEYSYSENDFFISLFSRLTVLPSVSSYHYNVLLNEEGYYMLKDWNIIGELITGSTTLQKGYKAGIMFYGSNVTNYNSNLFANLNLDGGIIFIVLCSFLFGVLMKFLFWCRSCDKINGRLLDGAILSIFIWISERSFNSALISGGVLIFVIYLFIQLKRIPQYANMSHQYNTSS